MPYFNAPIFLENKTQIGKVEEIFGPINNVYFTVKMSAGVVATSYSSVRPSELYLFAFALGPADAALALFCCTQSCVLAGR